MYRFKNHIPLFIGILVGAAGGYLYYHFVGCNGTCLIASSPFISTVYGAIMGGLTANLFQKKKIEERTT